MSGAYSFQLRRLTQAPLQLGNFALDVFLTSWSSFPLCFIIAARTRLVQHLIMKRFLFFPLLILPISIFAEGGLPDKPYIYVVGNAEIQKSADMVTLRFDVVARAPELPKANEIVQTSAIKVFDLLKSKKIAENDVIAEGLRSEPQFEQEQVYPRRGKVIGYTVNRTFEVKVRDITVFPRLVDQLLGLGDVEFSDIVSGLSKEKQINDELWDKALMNARERAEKTLKTMNMKIDSVFAVSPVSYPEIQGKIFGNFERVIVTGSNVPMQEPQYRLAGVTVSQSVHVIYLISPAK